MKRLLSGGLIAYWLLISPLTAAKEIRLKFFIISHGGAADPFWAVVRKGMEDAAKILSQRPDLKVEAIYYGPTVASPAEVVKLLDMALAAKPDGLAVTITDAQVVDEALRRIISAGIPIIAINVPDPRSPSEKIPYLCYVGGDEYLGGVKAAEKFLEIAKTQKIQIKRALVAPQEVGHVGLETRAKGFLDIMKSKGIPADKIQIFGEDPTKSVEILRSYFVTYPETNVIFTLGPMGTLAAMTFLTERGLAGKVLHGTYDLDAVTIEAIKRGLTSFAIVQQPYLQGYLPITFLTLYKLYGLMPINDILTGPMLVDKKNIDQMEKFIFK
ncbi:MAG: sugar ABC transporter substrate-binding protein [Candidatus Aminicenantes bacterium]|nr:sugar ABC transporter substrate-binding protein [Candidatus Aminicenantes bacterium]